MQYASEHLTFYLTFLFELAKRVADELNLCVCACVCVNSSTWIRTFNHWVAPIGAKHI